jgi:class 3 adenylate cyclase
MTCTACAHENPAGAKFCEECGQALGRACASCGLELRPGVKFCSECGTPVADSTAGNAPPAVAARAPSAGTRKTVTIVFADLVGSTALHERLDPESARRFMESYYVAMRAAVESHGGTVTQLLGDGVKAVFGIPLVAEDDAIRAVRAAALMQQEFRDLANLQSGAVGKTGLRVAVNTGEVVAVGESEIIGDPVNVAARLQERGQDGDVVVGDSTARLVDTLVTLEPLGSFALKGRAVEVAAFRLASLERPAGAAAAAFVGREDELSRLRAVYATTTTEPLTSLAVLVGSPGLGKSRIIDEFTRELGEAATLVTAQCDEASADTFAPLTRALRRFLDIDAGASTEELRASPPKGAGPASLLRRRSKTHAKPPIPDEGLARGVDRAASVHIECEADGRQTDVVGCHDRDREVRALENAAERGRGNDVDKRCLEIERTIGLLVIVERDLVFLEVLAPDHGARGQGAGNPESEASCVADMHGRSGEVGTQIEPVVEGGIGRRWHAGRIAVDAGSLGGLVRVAHETLVARRRGDANRRVRARAAVAEAQIVSELVHDGPPLDERLRQRAGRVHAPDT